MMDAFKRWRGLAAFASMATFVAALALAPPAQAQEEEVLEEIVVTGSRIAKDEFSSPAPISVFSAEDFMNSGVVSVDEFLKDIPAFTGFQFGTSTNNGNIGTKSVDLRGLGNKRTLILVNGRRQVGSFIGGQGDVGAVDLNTIPNGMIERIEVLKDGASTIYGSDALAGVVNVILKNDFEGVEMYATYGAGMEDWDAENYSFGVTAGTSSDRGRFVVSAEYQNQDELYQADRDWAYYDLHPVWDADCGSGAGCFVTNRGGSPNSRRIRTSLFDDAANALLLLAFPNPDPTNPDYNPPSSYIIDESTGEVRPFSFASDAYNYSPVNAIVTPNERYQLSGVGEYELTDSLSFFAELMYTRRSSHQRLAPDASFAIGDFNGHWNDFVPASNPGNPFGDNPDNPWGISGQDVRINRRFEESGGRLFTQAVDTYRILAGLRGDLTDTITWELSYLWAENEDFNDTKFYHRFDRWETMVDPALCGADPACVEATGGVGYLDPFQPFGTIPTSVFGYLMANSLKDIRLNDMELFSANLTGDFTNMELDGGTPAWSVGYEHRRESASFNPDEFIGSGLTTGGAGDPIGGRFTVDEFYGEVYLPFTDKFTTEASFRYSDYDTVGDSTNFRLGGNFAPTDTLNLRAVYSTGFRAPNIVELYGGDQGTFPLVADPCEFWNRRLDASPYLGPNCTALGMGEEFEWGGQIQSYYVQTAPDPGTLEPEDSTTWSIGAVWEPQQVEGLSMSLDYWTIEVEKYIGAPNYNLLMWMCANAADQDNDPSCQFFVTDNDYQTTHYTDPWPGDAYVPLANLGTVETAGLDMNVSYDRAVNFLGANSMSLVFGATWLEKYETTYPVVGTSDLAGTIVSFQALPEWKINTVAALHADNWSASWATRYYSEMPDGAQPAYLSDDAVAESIWYHDLYLNYDFAEGYSLLIGIDNVTDEDPPRFHSAFNAETEPGVYDVIGRRFYTGITIRFE